MKCAACDAEIRWVKTLKGKSMPVDAVANSTGNVVVRDGLAVVLGPLELEILEDEVRWMPHFATCPKWVKR